MRATTFLSSSILALAPVITAAVPSISGFTLQFSDDFTGSSGTLPSSSNWIIDTGTQYNSGCPAQWGTGEIETYTSSTKNVALDGNGHLAITPLKSSSGAWTSARIETVRKDFAAPANGRMIAQASIALPNLPASQSQGLWPAFVCTDVQGTMNNTDDNLTVDAWRKLQRSLSRLARYVQTL